MTASKLARVLAISVVLPVLSLGGVAHAQERGDPPPQGGITQPAPENPPPTPENPPPTPENPPAAPQNPPSATPQTAPTTPTTEKPDPHKRPPVTPPTPVASTRVRVSPQAGGPGTVVTFVADIRGSCDPASNFFQDRRQGAPRATRWLTGMPTAGGRFVAQYTVSSNDAAGWGRFVMSCDARSDTYRVTYARFRVLPAGAGGQTGNGRQTADRHDGNQLPGRVDTGLGGTAGGGQGGLDRTLVLLPAGLLLIVLAAVLRLRQGSGRTRQ